MREEKGERFCHQVQLGVELLADPFGHGDGDVDEGEGRAHPDAMPPQDGQQVQQHHTHLDLP
jgi:hypothetical protein